MIIYLFVVNINVRHATVPITWHLPTIRAPRLLVVIRHLLGPFVINKKKSIVAKYFLPVLNGCHRLLFCFWFDPSS